MKFRAVVLRFQILQRVGVRDPEGIQGPSPAQFAECVPQWRGGSVSVLVPIAATRPTKPSHRYSGRDDPTEPSYHSAAQPSTSASYGQHGPTQYSGSRMKKEPDLHRSSKRASRDSRSRSPRRRPKIRSRSRDKKRIPDHYLSHKEDSGAYLRYTGSRSQSRDSQPSPRANVQQQDDGHQGRPQGAYPKEQVRTPPYVTLPPPTSRVRRGPGTP